MNGKMKTTVKTLNNVRYMAQSDPEQLRDKIRAYEDKLTDFEAELRSMSNSLGNDYNFGRNKLIEAILG